MDEDGDDNKFQLDEASQKKLADIIQEFREQKVTPAPEPKPKTLSEIHGEILAEGHKLDEAGIYTFDKFNPERLGNLVPSNSPGEPRRWHFQNYANIYRPEGVTLYPPHLSEQHAAVPEPKLPAPPEQSMLAHPPALTADPASAEQAQDQLDVMRPPELVAAPVASTPAAFASSMPGEAQREQPPPGAFQDVQRERPPADAILAAQRSALDDPAAAQDSTREQGVDADIEAEKRQSRSADAEEYQAEVTGEKKERDKQIALAQAQAQAKAQAQAQNRD